MDWKKIEKVLAKEPKYRLAQIKKAIFVDLIEDWTEATTLPKELREKLTQLAPLQISAEFFDSKDSRTNKALVILADGQKIETVLMRHKDRNTVCLSSQVGCSMGCVFCATGELGLKRNLTSEEIISQVLLWARILEKEGDKITNLVFMGMGEPFLNYENVLQAIKFLHSADTFNLGARRFSISTCGVTEGIKKLAKEEMEINLAISLNAATDGLRSKLMPINKRYPLADVLRAVKDYLKNTNRKVMFEYAMIKGVNDASEEAEKLAKLLKDFLCVVNLIPYNDTQKFHASDTVVINRFKEILENYGINAVQRYKFGEEINAACGQLAGRR